MGLYNMIHGYNQAAYLVLPMLGKHEQEYGRFRDCWLEPRGWTQREDGFPVVTKVGEGTKDAIYVYTRNGGGNRPDYKEVIRELRHMPTYIDDYDDDFDRTYATFVFAVPDEWLADYTALLEKRYADLSQAYLDLIGERFPKAVEMLESLRVAAIKEKMSDADAA